MYQFVEVVAVKVGCAWIGSSLNTLDVRRIPDYRTKVERKEKVGCEFDFGNLGVGRWTVKDS